MTKVCARPLCYELATVRFWFDGENRHVILDRKVEEWGGSGILCEEHADRLTVARGWQLDDRRVMAPRLFAVGGTTKPGVVARAKRLIQPSPHPSTPLPLEGGPTYALPEGYEEATPLDVRPILRSAEQASQDRYDAQNPPKQQVHDREIDAQPDSRTPLLARAFDAASSRVRPSSSLDSLIPRSAPLPDDDEDLPIREAKRAEQ
jgi:hypothetical protein